MNESKLKPSIAIQFIDFWPDFDLPNFMLYKLLLEHYDVSISNDPDILFYSVYGSSNAEYTCTKVFFTAENERPDFKACDYAFSFDFETNKRNYRLPLYAFYGDVKSLINSRKNITEILKSKTKFCCFIVSNPNSKTRNNFFKELSKIKHVDSGGSLYNNIGGLVENKREFIRNYKFVIAFENSSFPGYVTEKIFEPLMEDCVPIYWGSPVIGKDFNPKRFINSHDFPSFDEVIKHVIEVDNDDEKYLQYLKETAFNNDEPYESLKKENILNRLDEIIRFDKNRSYFIKKIQKFRPLYCLTKIQFNKVRTRVLSVFKINGRV